MKHKFVITRWNGRILTALISDGQVVELNTEDETALSIVNNIYIGKVKDVVKNINSAFVELGNGMTGYYSLTENPKAVFAAPKKTEKLCAGDEIIVQVSKDAVKTKDPVLSSKFNLPGRYCVLTAGTEMLGFSGKITDVDWKQNIRPGFEALLEEGVGFIVRTNAAMASPETVLAEAGRLKEQYLELLKSAPYRTCYSLLYKAPAAYLSSILGVPAGTLDEIITDDQMLFDEIQEFLSLQAPELSGSLTFYRDDMLSLLKLYRLETEIEHALQPRVWLKSGGYLVIEYTEALTVIDVNTGKYSGKKNAEETTLNINLEAGKEAARQIRLRNLSGIILIDFIDMKSAEYREQLLRHMALLVSADSVKTIVVDFTKLQLMEITRKKQRRPLYEQLKR